MKSLSKMLRGSCAIITSGALVFSTLPAMAQDQPPPGAQLPPPGAQLPPPPEGQQPPQPAVPQLGQAELEKLLAPIALYPDDLVAQILTASTYPIEIVEAERWLSAHPNIHGDPLQDSMQQQPWDPSVKGLTAVPQVLSMMNDKLEWTQQLGEAFLAQPNDVSNAIQQLRLKAEANGNLKSSDKIRVSRVAPPEPLPPAGPVPVGVDPAYLPPPPPPEYIVIEPYDPGVYYVPIYDPYVVYGPWGWPAYRPFYWYPPGYVVGAAVIGFGVGFAVGAALWSHYNWGWHGGWAGGGPVTINVVNYNRFNRTSLVAGQNHWQFDAVHRGSAGFQNAALRQQFGTPRNFQERSFQGTRGPLQGNLQGTQQGTQGQFHIQGNQGNALQGNQGKNFQGKTLQGNQGNALQGNQGKFQSNQSLTPGGTGSLNTKSNTKVNSNARFNTNTNVNTNANANTNTRGSTNANVNANTHVNTNANVNTNTHVNTNANVNANINRNLNVNQNQNQNVNRNLNANRNFNGGGGGGGGGGGNQNRGGNFTRSAGPPGGGGGKGGGGGGKGGKPDDRHH
jgi:Protein of unknown function (DUF3300)